MVLPPDLNEQQAVQLAWLECSEQGIWRTLLDGLACSAPDHDPHRESLLTALERRAR